MQRPTTDRIDWETLRIHSENLAVRFADGDDSHYVMITRESLEDGLRTQNHSLEENFNSHKVSVEHAIRSAFKRADWQELVQIDTGQTAYHLYVKPTDFPNH